VDEREQIAWMARRVGFGLGAGQLDALAAVGPSRTLDLLIDPVSAGVDPAPASLWADLTFDPYANRRANGAIAIATWLDALVTSQRPLEEWMAWYWHGVLVSSYAEVPDVRLMTRQIDLFRSRGLGSFPALLADVTTDAAMLVYLDGTTSVASAPNENYGREMLELFAVGIGSYTEADVQAAARALTGWRVRRAAGDVVFRPGQHDPTPQTLLGVDGVSDLASTIDAVVNDPACAPFVAGGLARAILGPDVADGVVEDLAAGFAEDGLEIRPLVRQILEAGLAGEGGSLVQGPVEWAVAAQRATGAAVEARTRLEALQAAGQLPLVPPNVGGWPGGAAWLGSSTTAARFNLSAALASATAGDQPCLQAAADGDLGALADALARPAGFGEGTAQALDDLHRTGDAAAVLTVALSSPDLVVA
jgi:uncharacterized protein (DUF1800 family)